MCRCIILIEFYKVQGVWFCICEFIILDIYGLFVNLYIA